MFLGYGIGVKGYRLFDTDTSKVFHSRDVLFNETASISEQGTEEVENQPFVEVDCENISSDDDENSREAIESRRSPRIRKAPDQYGEWVYIAHRLDDPLTVKEAFPSPEKREWMKALKSQINSLNTYKVCIAVGEMVICLTLYILGTTYELRNYSLTHTTTKVFICNFEYGLFLMLQDSWCLGLLDV